VSINNQQKTSKLQNARQSRKIPRQPNSAESNKRDQFAILLYCRTAAVISLPRPRLRAVHCLLLSLPINDTTHYNFSFLQPLSASEDLINTCNYIPPHYQSLHATSLLFLTKKPSRNIVAYAPRLHYRVYFLQFHGINALGGTLIYFSNSQLHKENK